jgi:N6-adenosine-specific RNA methylase IME4
MTAELAYSATPDFTALPRGHAKVILAYPPWWFSTYSDKGWGKSAHSHYSCMSLDDVKALPVASLAAPDCVLVLWSTQTHLPMALDVLETWGFTYKTAGAWAKLSKSGTKWPFGTGYILRSAAEFFLIGTRGSPRTRARNKRNLIVAPVREHSRKPDEIYELIEALWPGPYVELFARHRRLGWWSWGDEASPAPPLCSQLSFTAMPNHEGLVPDPSAALNSEQRVSRRG